MNVYQETVVNLLKDALTDIENEILFVPSVNDAKILELKQTRLQETLDIVLNDKLHLQD